MNLLSILIIIIFVVFMVMGFRKGIIRSVIGTAAIILSFFLSYFLSHLASRLIIDRTSLDDYIDAKIYEKIEVELKQRAEEKLREELEDAYGEAAAGIELTDSQIEQAINAGLSRSQQIEAISKLPLPEYMKEALIDNNNSEIYDRLQVTDFCHYISRYIAYMAVNLIAFVLLFILIRLFFMIFSILLGTIGELPIISGVNHMGGLVLGAVMALFVSWIVLTVLSAVSGLASSTAVDEMISDSSFLTILNDKNLVKSAMTNITDILF